MSGLADRVLARDRRLWNVAAVTVPTPADDEPEFEHDIAAGQVAGVAMLVLLLTLVFVLITLRPDDLVFPWYLWLVLLAGAGALVWQGSVDRGTYTVEAVTDPTETAPGELWTATVVGRRAAERTVKQVTTQLRRRGRPDQGRPLQLMD